MLGSRPWIMALALTTVLAASASAQMQTFLSNGQAIGLLTDPKNQKELNLDEEQVKKAVATTEAALKRVREMRDEARELESKTPGAGVEALAKQKGVVAADYKKAIAAILKPEQLKKLREITIRQIQHKIFEDPEVRSEFKLTQEQHAKIKEIDARFQKQMQENSRLMLNPETRVPASLQSREISRRVKEDVLEVFTEEQKIQWEVMHGPPSPPSQRPKP